MPASANIARHLALMADAHPNWAALKIPRGRTVKGDIEYLTLTFAELEQEVDEWSRLLSHRGVRPGDRTLITVKPGLPLIASVFGLFKLGAVPIIIDPGMGLKNFLVCVARSRPSVLLGIPLAQLISRIFRPSFQSVRVRVGAKSDPLARLAKTTGPTERFETKTRAPGDLAAILFTSGSTGPPKGVCYEHGMFEAQVRLIRETYSIELGEIDLPMLPVFALFNPALGMTTIVPEIDPRHPAQADPATIVQAIQQERVTNSFGSPTLWNRVGAHCIAHNLTLPSLRRVLCAGAPVPVALWKKSGRFLSNGQLHSPYGATETLPVSSASAEEIARAVGEGACLGRPVSEMEVRIIKLSDLPLRSWSEVSELPAGQIGEIVVRGPVVTKTYDALPEATALAKIFCDSPARPFANDDASQRGELWHRMGDCGYRDANGLLWFCGRKAERVETATGPLFTEPCERIFSDQPEVARCALIGLGKRGEQKPALVIEPTRKLGALEKRELVQALHERGRNHKITSSITRFFFHSHFPVDVRHNAKIHRLALAKWAASASSIDVVS